jgi:hypothetical protein
MRAQRFFAAFAAGLLSLQLSACATPGPILTQSVGTLRTGLAQTRQQADASFTLTNSAAREIDIARALDSDRRSLAEADFPLALDPADIQRWSNAFTVLDSYLAALQRLVAPERAQATGNNLDALAAQLQSGATALSLPAEATAAFSTFASALVQASAERRAQDVMRQVDPAFTAVMAGLADAIGIDDRTGLRGTSRIFWENKLSDLRTAYSRLDATDRSGRRSGIDKFIQTIDARNAQLRSLSDLRASVLALGEAHTAAASGDNGNAQFWIGRIGGWLDDVRKRTEAAQAQQSAGGDQQ